MKILIDNGHGRETAGKRSPDGRLLEWSYNREIARRVVASLSSLGFDAELLVPENEDIPLAERCRRANLLCSQLGTRNVALVSIHVNAAGRGDKWYNADGWCCYTSTGQTAGDALANYLCQAALQNLPGHRMRFDYPARSSDALRLYGRGSGPGSFLLHPSPHFLRCSTDGKRIYGLPAFLRLPPERRRKGRYRPAPR